MNILITLWQWHCELWENWRVQSCILMCVLTTARCPIAMVSPMATGASPFTSGRFTSHTPNTTSTSTNPRKNSTPKPCKGVTPFASVVIPNRFCASIGVRACNIYMGISVELSILKIILFSLKKAAVSHQQHLQMMIRPSYIDTNHDNLLFKHLIKQL